MSVDACCKEPETSSRSRLVDRESLDPSTSGEEQHLIERVFESQALTGRNPELVPFLYSKRHAQAVPFPSARTQTDHEGRHARALSGSIGIRLGDRADLRGRRDPACRVAASPLRRQPPQTASNRLSRPDATAHRRAAAASLPPPRTRPSPPHRNPIQRRTRPRLLPNDRASPCPPPTPPAVRASHRHS
jgi:hypothetical protein